MFHFQCQNVNLKNGWFQYTTNNFSRLTHRAFASIRALPRIEIWWNFLSFHAVYLVHFCRKLVNKSSECLGVRVSHFFSQSSHHPADMSRSRISINPLRLDCTEPFYRPKVIQFGPKNNGSLSSYRQSVGVSRTSCKNERNIPRQRKENSIKFRSSEEPTCLQMLCVPILRTYL